MLPTTAPIPTWIASSAKPSTDPPANRVKVPFFAHSQGFGRLRPGIIQPSSPLQSPLMVAFWILAALMTAVALAFVLVPMLRAPALRGPSQSESNLAVLRGQRREIEADVANGTLPAGVRKEPLAELVDRAQADLSTPDPSAPAHTRQPWLAAAPGPPPP